MQLNKTQQVFLGLLFIFSCMLFGIIIKDPIEIIQPQQEEVLKENKIINLDLNTLDLNSNQKSYEIRYANVVKDICEKVSIFPLITSVLAITFLLFTPMLKLISKKLFNHTRIFEIITNIGEMLIVISATLTIIFYLIQNGGII